LERGEKRRKRIERKLQTAGVQESDCFEGVARSRAILFAATAAAEGQRGCVSNCLGKEEVLSASFINAAPFKNNWYFHSMCLTLFKNESVNLATLVQASQLLMR
jgi:hypothetical protein